MNHVLRNANNEKKGLQIRMLSTKTIYFGM